MNTTYFYWGTTGLLALFAAGSGTMYFVSDAPAATIVRLGYPDYFYLLLGAAKLVGAVLLVVPGPRALKEWTYAGFTFDFVAAGISHVAVGDPASSLVAPAVALALLVGSYAAYHRHVLADAGEG
jgi:hypothetical protein